MTDAERALAAFVADLEYGDLPESVRDRLGLVVADTVGAIVGGAADPAVSELAGLEAASNPGGASMLGTDHAAAPGHAAMVNATGGTSLELDEGHKYAAGHPAIHALPAALAEAEVDGASPERLLAGFVAGYEAGTRVALACNPLDPTYHMHGLWGGVGAAAAVARYRGFDTDRTLEAMRMAANSAQHTRFDAATEGATVRNTYAGMSNLSGIAVANQAAAGFTGLERGIERHLGRVTREGDAFDPAELAAGLGERWEVERGYFKVHAACRYTHPVLDAIAEMEEREGRIDPDAVESVTVEVYEAAAKLTPTRPANPLQAKFSIPFAVATRLRHGHSRREAFAAEAFTEPVFSLAERVTVEAAEDLTARVPDERGARVTVALADGRELSASVRQARGGAERPFVESDLREKFGALVAPALGEGRTAPLWEAARNPAGTAPGELCSLATPG